MSSTSQRAAGRLQPALRSVTNLRWRFGALAALVLLALGANLTVLATSSQASTESAVLLVPPVDVSDVLGVGATRGFGENKAAGFDYLNGIEVQQPTGLVIDPTASLPTPEPPPQPYAPTPEIRLGTISIPAIGLEQPLFEGVTLISINRGPSHWPGTALPGELGNVVVAGHRTTYSRPFWALNELDPGDELIFTVDGRQIVYELVELEIVAPSEIRIIEQTTEHTATLFACHPRGSARQRIVAHFRQQTTKTVVVHPDRPS